MDNSAKNKKFRKIIAIIVVVVLVVFALLVIISKRPQHAGAGKTSAEDYNSRIDYRDEMNCRVGGSGDEGGFVLAATDGWSKVSIENLEINGTKVNIKIIDDAIYYNDGSDKLFAYNLDYLNHEKNIDLFEMLKVNNSGTTISCRGQNKNMYVVENQARYKDITSWKYFDETEE